MKPFVLKQKTKTSTKKDISQKNTQYNYVFLTNTKRIVGYHMSLA